MGLHHDEDRDGVADRVYAIKKPGEPMRYRRDVSRDDQFAIDAEIAHVRAHLASVADSDDDPTTHAGDVVVRVTDHVDGDPALVSVIGELDAEPDAPYLKPGYDPALDDDGTTYCEYQEVWP